MHSSGSRKERPERPVLGGKGKQRNGKSLIKRDCNDTPLVFHQTKKFFRERIRHISIKPY